MTLAVGVIDTAVDPMIVSRKNESSRPRQVAHVTSASKWANQSFSSLSTIVPCIGPVTTKFVRSVLMVMIHITIH